MKLAKLREGIELELLCCCCCFCCCCCCCFCWQDFWNWWRKWPGRPPSIFVPEFHPEIHVTLNLGVNVKQRNGKFETVHLFESKRLEWRLESTHRPHKCTSRVCLFCFVFCFLCLFFFSSFLFALFCCFSFFFFLVSFIPTGGHHLFPSWLISFIQTVGIFGKVNGPNHRPARPRWRLSIPAPSTGRINGWIEHHINVFFSLHNIIIWFMYKPIENWIRIRQWIE